MPASLPKLLRILLVMLLVAIMILATLPAPPDPFETLGDKFNHVLAFLVLGLLASAAYRQPPLPRTLSLLLGYGALIEVCQYWLPWRDASWADLLADAAGLLLAACITRLATRRRQG